MSSNSRIGKFILLWLGSVGLTLLTFFIGTPFLRVLRDQFGAKIYWASGFLTVLIFEVFPANVVGLLLGANWILVGLFYELEARGYRWWSSAWVSLFISTLFSALYAGVALFDSGVSKYDDLLKLADRVISQFDGLLHGVKIDAGAIVQQIPSGYVAILIFGLGVSLISDRTVARWMGLGLTRRVGQIRMLDFRVPDGVVWVGLIALFLMLVDLKSPALTLIGTSFVNILTAVYFFQGLAVFEVFLFAIRAGPLLRLISYFLIVGNLFLLLSVIGFMDFWVDFRRRFRKFRPLTNS